MLTLALCLAASQPIAPVDVVHREGDWLKLAARVQRPVRALPAEKPKMAAYLKSLYQKAAVRHSFVLHTGDEVDCVDVARQPALRRAELKGHRIQKAPPPPRAPAIIGNRAAQPFTRAARAVAIDALVRAGKDAKGRERKCPAGSIPIRKTALADLHAFPSMSDVFARLPQSARRGSRDGHQYAHASRGGLRNYGAISRLNVWNPAVSHDGIEFSLSQIWVTAGSGNREQTLEAGVQVLPSKYGDRRARLFIYSTSDGYAAERNQDFSRANGCYNLDCSRFIQVDGSIVIGAPFAAYSVTGGAQREIEIGWFRGPGGWWLWVGGHWVGYYPTELFSALKHHATGVDFGGEIVDDRSAHRAHTTTNMGSGHFPRAGFGKAAFQRRLGYFPSPDAPAWTALSGLDASRTDAKCYDIGDVVEGDPDWGTWFFFGGTGYSRLCK